MSQDPKPTFYLVDNNSNVYLCTVEAPLLTSQYAFQCIYRPDLPPIGIAAGKGYKIGESTQQTAVFVLKQLSFLTYALVAYKNNGEQIAVYELKINSRPLGICPVDPDGTNPRFLVTTNRLLCLVTILPDDVSVRSVNTDFLCGQGLGRKGDTIYLTNSDASPLLMSATVTLSPFSVSQSDVLATRLLPQTCGIFSLDGNGTYTLENFQNQLALHRFSGILPTGRGSKFVIGRSKVTDYNPSDGAGYIDAVAAGEIYNTGGTLPFTHETNIPSVKTIEYSYSGEPLGSINSISFGQLAPSEMSSPRIVKLKVSNINQIYNVKLGIVNASVQGVPVQEVFLIGHKLFLDSNYIPTEYFPGVNTSQSADDQFNVNVGTEATPIGIPPTGSDYVYLAVKNPARYLGSGECVYRWYFDYV